MKNTLQKGSFGYLNKLKVHEWLKALLYLSIPIAVYIAVLLINGEQITIITVMVLVGCIPGCNQTVHAILATRYHSIDRTLYEEVEEAKGERLAVYEYVFTTYEKNYYIDSIIISGRELAGYSSDAKLDTVAAAEHLTKILRQNSYKQNVKIITDRKAFLSRARDLAQRMPEEVPFRGDDRYPGLSREEVIREVLNSISL